MLPIKKNLKQCKCTRFEWNEMHSEQNMYCMAKEENPCEIMAEKKFWKENALEKVQCGSWKYKESSHLLKTITKTWKYMMIIMPLNGGKYVYTNNSVIVATLVNCYYAIRTHTHEM